MLKKLSVVAALLSVLMLSLPALAVNSNYFANCYLVPMAKFNSGATTTVGLTSRSSGVIRWIFYDQDGDRLDQGAMQVSDGLYNEFILREEAASSLSNELGFLLFCLDDDDNGELNFRDEPDLAANAFLLRDDDRRDAVFIPTLPLYLSDLDDDDLRGDIDEWNEDPIENLRSVAGPDDDVYAQYFVDGIEGNDEKTTVYIYTTDSPGSSETLAATGPAVANVAVTARMGRFRLNELDVESLPGFDDPGLLRSGYLLWDVPDDIDDVFIFSMVESAEFSATQTLIGHVYDDDD